MTADDVAAWREKARRSEAQADEVARHVAEYRRQSVYLENSVAFLRETAAALTILQPEPETTELRVYGQADPVAVLTSHVHAWVPVLTFNPETSVWDHHVTNWCTTCGRTEYLPWPT